MPVCAVRVASSRQGCSGNAAYSFGAHLSLRAMQTTRPSVWTRWAPIGAFISALIASAALLQSSSDANPSICWVVGLVGLPRTIHCKETKRTHSIRYLQLCTSISQPVKAALLRQPADGRSSVLAPSRGMIPSKISVLAVTSRNPSVN
jgi:hypothetical protein